MEEVTSVSTNQVDRIVEELDAAMRDLRDAMRGIPIRRGSFTKTHDNLARDVAQVTTMLDAARPILRKTG
jgi:hypothetical protein